MEGITILSTNSEMVWTDSTAITFIVLITLALLCVLVSIFIIDWNNNCGIILFGFSAVIFLIGISTDICGPKEPFIKHQVLIDKSVSMTEFHNKYTLLDQDGQIYTIIEKDFSK